MTAEKYRCPFATIYLYLPPSDLAKSRTRGRGVYTCENILKNTFIGFYEAEWYRYGTTESWQVQFLCEQLYDSGDYV
jgi:hypothetical protein